MNELDVNNFHINPCVFRNRNMSLILGVYIDDVIILGEEDIIKDFINKMGEMLLKKDVNKFFGCEFLWNEKMMRLICIKRDH